MGFDEKAKENKEFAEKLMIEQKARKLRQNKRDGELLRKLDEKTKEQVRLKEEAEWEKERIRQERVEIMMEKRKERENYLKEMKDVAENEYRRVVSSTPLYKKLEISYFSNVEMPELENRKEELKRKREKFRPVDYNQLKEHARSIDSKRSEHHKSKIIQSDRNCIKKSKLIKKFIQEENEKRMEEQKKFSIKKQMASKKKEYSEVVKVIHAPSIDPLKQKEMALLIAILTPPVIIKKLNRGTNDNFPLYLQNTPQSKSPVLLNTKEPTIKASKQSLSHPLFSPVNLFDTVQN